MGVGEPQIRRPDDSGGSGSYLGIGVEAVGVTVVIDVAVGVGMAIALAVVLVLEDIDLDHLLAIAVVVVHGGERDDLCILAVCWRREDRSSGTRESKDERFTHSHRHKRANRGEG
jgi:hypothetical protein